MKNSRYEVVSTSQVVQQQAPLNDMQRSVLHKVLEPFQALFDGNLVAEGKLPQLNVPKVSLEPLPDSTPSMSTVSSTAQKPGCSLART